MCKVNKISEYRANNAFYNLETADMILFKEAAKLNDYISRKKDAGHKIGFVPTMGALHPGHISLIKTSIENCDITVCSIFVNPTQFNDQKDFEKYPVTIGNDIQLLEEAGCDILFLPSVNEIYPAGTISKIHYDLGDLENKLEGKYRPGHFQGVCQVVHRLLEIVTPNKIFLGRKDYQQCLVIKKLVEIIALPVEVVIANTYRQEDGLAMSSRNLRLNNEQLHLATGISKMLEHIKQHYANTPLTDLTKESELYLLKNGFNKVDYVSISDANNLDPAVDIKQNKKLVALVAATIGDIRLIDNMVLTD